MIRSLTAGEAALARATFGESLGLSTVRFLRASWPFDRAFVPGRWFGRDWIVWPGRGLPPDISLAPLHYQAVFVHELTHVWQDQQGVNLLIGKLRAGDRPSSYAYAVGLDCAWAGLNIEQQAMVVQHRFCLSRGQPAPADPAFYDRVCPVGPRLRP